MTHSHSQFYGLRQLSIHQNPPQYPSSHPRTSSSDPYLEPRNGYGGSNGNGYGYGYGGSNMSRSRNYSHTSSNSDSSSQGYISNSTASSPPELYAGPPSPYSYEQRSPPNSIDVVYIGPAGGARQKQSKSKPSKESSAKPEYPCLYPGCSHISGRPFDLQRHMKKHNPPTAEEKFDCPGKGCGRVGKYGFDRKDHMREHLRNFHNKDIPKQGSHGGRSSRR